MPTNYDKIKLKVWARLWAKLGLEGELVSRGRATHYYVVKSKSPIMRQLVVKRPNMLICGCDNFWPNNFGGHATVRDEYTAAVEVYVD